MYKFFEKNKRNIYSTEFINQILNDIENIASMKSYDFIDVKVEENKLDNDKLNFNFIVSDQKVLYWKNWYFRKLYNYRRSCKK